jgi:hypothetical protein
MLSWHQRWSQTWSGRRLSRRAGRVRAWALVLGVAATVALLPATAAASDGVPYGFTCSLGAPIVIHGHAPATVRGGESFAVTDVFLHYTNPNGVVSYTGTRVTIPAPPGTTGSDLVIEIPQTVTLDPGETFVSPPIEGTFVGSGQAGTVIEFRPTRLTQDSASTVGGGPLDCTFFDGPAFATTTVVANGSAAPEPVAAAPSFTG